MRPAGSFAPTFLGMVVFGAANGIEDVGMNVSGAANEQALGRSIMPIFHAFFSFGTMIGADSACWPRRSRSRSGSTAP